MMMGGKHPDETSTMYAIRAIQFETWDKAHVQMCPNDFVCTDEAHDNPHQEYTPR